MQSPGARPCFDERAPLEFSDHGVVGSSGFGIERIGSGRDELRVRVVDSAQWRVDGARVGCGVSFDDGQVGFSDQPILEADREFAVREVVGGGDEDSGGVSIEPVHDPGSQQPDGVGRLVEVVLESIDERIGSVECGRVNDQPGRLVDCHQPLILEDHFERYGRGLQQVVGRFEQSGGDLLPGVDSLCEIGGVAVDLYGFGSNQPVNSEPGVVPELSGDDRIDASTSEIVGDGEVDFGHLVLCLVLRRIPSGNRALRVGGRVLVRHHELQRAQ